MRGASLLIGIGQPFEAVTVAGRIATVASILTALVVVPLQLANLVGGENLSIPHARCAYFLDLMLNPR